ncbi:MAG: synthase protein [Gammaproteobacteria bacterium]|jgi:ATP synthase protein I|nr:synthase protein [Gammaproteobacteria bacterium]
MSDEHGFVRQVAAKAARKLKAQRTAERPTWFGLGMLGTIGWSVAVPTLAGALLGAWWDRHHPGPHSWTLALLILGLMLGCANAWHWVSTEDKGMHEPKDPP